VNINGARGANAAREIRHIVNINVPRAANATREIRHIANVNATDPTTVVLDATREIRNIANINAIRAYFGWIESGDSLGCLDDGVWRH